MRITTFHHPTLSLGQSALHETLLRLPEAHSAALSTDGAPDPAAHLAANDPRMQQFVALAHADGHGDHAPAAPAAEGYIENCARKYWQLVKTAAEHGPAAARSYYEADIQFQGCDAHWAEAATTFLAFIESGKSIPYIRLGMNEGILPLPAPEKGAPLRVAVVGDWGTGAEPARRVLRQIVSQKPDVLIHLGDIYYAGTPHEAQANFMDVIASFPELEGVPVYTLAGNHDMYSGGAGYYSLLPKLKQPASYFCLRNADWQLVCMDTGLHDRDPFTVTWNTTRLEKSEAEWVVDKVRNSGGRKTILLSHHQLFSRNSPVGMTCSLFGKKAWGVNPRLHRQLREVLDDVTVWLWGHEHNTVIFEKTDGLPLGRCVGSGAIPVPTEPDPYADYTAHPLVAPGGVQVPRQDPKHRLSSAPNDYGEDLFYHGYAMVEFNGASATVTYYQVPPSRARTEAEGSTAVFAETFGAPQKVPAMRIADVKPEVPA